MLVLVVPDVNVGVVEELKPAVHPVKDLPDQGQHRVDPQRETALARHIASLQIHRDLLLLRTER
jgi:hypothetical protein